MEKYIVLQMVTKQELEFNTNVENLDNLILCDPDTEEVMVFDSLEEAMAFRDKYGISGQTVEYPTYD